MYHPISEVTRRYLRAYAAILAKMKTDMENAPLTDSVSQNFIVQMIPHHQGAVEMSENVLKYVRKRDIRALAKKIIAEQKQGIKELEAMLPSCGQVKNTEQELAAYRQKTKEIMQEMFQNMENAPQVNLIYEDFLLEMIPHHQGAVEMVQNALKYPVCEQLKPVLENILRTQQAEIAEMRAMLLPIPR